MNNDYYATLGISKTANDDEIKRAYRKLALEYHPDRNKTKEAEEKFKEVTKAYEVLSDPQKRSAYDQYGAAAFDESGGFDGGQTGRYGPFTYTYNTSGSDFDFGGFSDPFDIFEQFFGGGSAFGRRRPTYSLTISFMEAIKGTEKRVTIDSKSQTVKIPKGVDNGSRIRFGNYDVVIQVTPDKKFQRQGQDIVTQEDISFVQAILGDEITVETVEGEVKLKVPSGTQPATVIRLSGKGAPSVRGNSHGNHYVKINVIIPKHITAKQKELLESFGEVSTKKRWF